VDDERLEIVAGAQSQHFLAEWTAEFAGRPLARAGRKNLQRVAAKAVGALGGVVDSSGRGSVNADAAGTEAGRAFGPWTGNDVLLAGHGAGHQDSIKAPSLAQRPFGFA